MSRNIKIILIIMGSLLALCICAGVVAFLMARSAGQAIQQAVATDPAKIAKMAANIATYQLPPGYREQFGMEFFGFNIVAFGSDKPDNMMMLMQFPEKAGLSQAEMEKQMQQATAQQTGTNKNLQLQIVGETKTHIRDQNVSLTIREGRDAHGPTIRQVSGVFQGKGGPTLLMISAPTTDWNQSAIDAFINSLR